MGVIESIGTLRDKIATNKFDVIEASIPLMERVLSEVLRRVVKIMNDGGYDELKFNSADLTETAKELQDYTFKIQRSISADKLTKKKLSINDTVDVWNRATDFISRALLVSQKLSLMGYLMQIIEEHTVENTLEYTILETLRSFLKE